jgi:hypothetical protein
VPRALIVFALLCAGSGEALAGRRCLVPTSAEFSGRFDTKDPHHNRVTIEGKRFRWEQTFPNAGPTIRTGTIDTASCRDGELRLSGPNYIDFGLRVGPDGRPVAAEFRYGGPFLDFSLQSWSGTEWLEDEADRPPPEARPRETAAELRSREARERIEESRRAATEKRLEEAHQKELRDSFKPHVAKQRCDDSSWKSCHASCSSAAQACDGPCQELYHQMLKAGATEGIALGHKFDKCTNACTTEASRCHKACPEKCGSQTAVQ